MNDRRIYIAIALLALVYFSIPTFFRDLWTPDEPRYALVAQEMMRTGDYLVPRVNGEVYKEKPPLLFWGMAASSIPFGHITEPTARVPSVLAAVITLLLGFDLARRMYGQAAAILAALVLATAFRFWWQAQFGQIDMLLCACVTLSIYSLYRWNESRHAKWVIGLYSGIALGLLAKGPPALLFPIFTAVVFYRRELRTLGGLKPWWGLPAALAPVLVWMIPSRIAAGHESVSAQPDFVAEFKRQIVGRIIGGGGHTKPPWYFFQSLPVDWLPWTLFAPAIVLFAWRNRRDPSMRFLLCWIVPAFVFFSINATKREVYLVPMYPALAVVTAVSVHALAQRAHDRWRTLAVALWFIALAALASVPFVVRLTPYAEVWSPQLLLIPAICAACAGWSAVLVRNHAWPRFPYAFAVQIAALFVVGAILVFPAANRYKTSEPFLKPVRTLANAGDVNVYSVGLLREEYVYYSHVLHTPLLIDPGISALEPQLGRDATLRITRPLPRELAKAAAAVGESGGTESREEVREACRRAARDRGVPAELMADWEQSLKAEVAVLDQAFAGDSPAVMLVLARDWPWIRAFVERPEDFSTISQERVTSRDMLMLGNRAALDALPPAVTPEKG